MTRSPDSPTPGATSSSGRRRRRRRTDAPAAASAPETPPAITDPEEDAGRSRGGGTRTWVPAAWGLTPTFRVFLFLGAIVAVMAFLLYNEYLIGQFRAQERDRAELYARMYGLALSEALPPDVAGEIFQKIILNESINLPLIFTDHRGRILGSLEGMGLPGMDPGEVALREAMARMDAVNEPVRVQWTSDARGRVHTDGRRTIVTDPTGHPVAWSGEGLPEVSDGEPPEPVLAALSQMKQRGIAPLNFVAEASTTCYLAHATGQFVLIEMGDARPLAWQGEDLPSMQDTTRAAAVIVQARYERLTAQQEPVAFQLHTYHEVHYGDTEMLSRLSMAPVVTLVVLCLFGLIGTVGFRNMRRSEQRSIWVGMAKETAHQLGTPLSSLSGWLELMQQRLQEASSDDIDRAAIAEMATEMQRDMGRLNQIASRFSQIGSVPELSPGAIGDVIQDTVAYFRGRGSQFGRHHIEAEIPQLPTIPLNAELMGWVFENLFKNAIDAMTGQEGRIRVTARHDPELKEIVVVVSDNGRGIKANHLSRVFEPGFSTKKRGWGLGLAFVKRIIEEYHAGRIQVMQSEQGQGTSFEIALPTS